MEEEGVTDVVICCQRAGKGADLEVNVTEAKFEELSKALLKATVLALDTTLKGINKVDAVFVSGRRRPLIQSIL